MLRMNVLLMLILIPAADDYVDYDDLLRLLVSWLPYVSVVEGVKQEMDPTKIF